MFVDSHCHLSFDELSSNIPEILQAMAEAKVEAGLNICTTMEEFALVHKMALEHSMLWASVGVHPDYENVTEPTVDELIQAAKLSKVVAIGETGLDYFRLNGRSIAEMQWQRNRFITHIRAARSAQKPLVIHTRNASDDTLMILKDEGENGASGSAGGVFHCFTENLRVAKEALDLGFYISFSGILTFKNAVELREVAAMVPLDRILIETDSPYLAPVPYRGKSNNPSYVPFVAMQIAEIKNQPLEEVAKATTSNFYKLFKVDLS